jgi:hypothetical protein
VTDYEAGWDDAIDYAMEGWRRAAGVDALREAALELLSIQDADDDYCFSCHGPRPCEHDALRAALRG